MAPSERVWAFVPPNAYDRTEGSLGRPTRDGSSRMDGIGYIPTFGGGVHRSGTHEQVASAVASSGLEDAMVRSL